MRIQMSIAPLMAKKKISTGLRRENGDGTCEAAPSTLIAARTIDVRRAQFSNLNNPEPSAADNAKANHHQDQESTRKIRAEPPSQEVDSWGALLA
jgi:hypothetical protein